MSQDQLLSAVLEPRRRAILRVLDAEGGLAVGKLATHFDVSRPAISQHLAVLREAGLVEVRSESGRNTYCVIDQRVSEAREAIAELVSDLPGGSVDVVPVAPADATRPARPSDGDAAPPEVALEVLAAASPEQVFAVASTVAGQERWLGRAAADAEPGGRFHVDLGGDVAAGTYAVVDRPSHLAFGWGQEGGPMAPDSSRVDLWFYATGPGTLIRLVHGGLPPAAHAPHFASWVHHLLRLAEAAEAVDATG